MPITFLHIGSNEGDRLGNLRQAVALLEDRAGKLLQCSPIYQTVAWGIEEQPDFLNQALELRTPLSPLDLLDTVLGIENDMGRVRYQKWGQRLIDIDLLFYDELMMESERLHLPHPFLHERNFVLRPLLDIAPDWVHPKLGLTVRALSELCADPLPAEVYTLDRED